MATLTYREAVARGIAQEMARDERVILIGEDVAEAGGVFKTTEGLRERFGPRRVRDTPISEEAITGITQSLPRTVSPKCTSSLSPAPLTLLARIACIPPWAAAE